MGNKQKKKQKAVKDSTNAPPIQKTIWLVDLENVHNTWRPVIAKLGPADEVWCFYTQNAPTIQLDIVTGVLDKGAAFIPVKCHPGKKTGNALDFQLSGQLGCLIATYGRKKDDMPSFVILSNDTGYDPLLQYWQDRGVTARRIRPNGMSDQQQVSAPASGQKSKKQLKKEKKAANAKYNVELQTQFRNELKNEGLSKMEAHELAIILMHGLPAEKQARLRNIHNAVISKFGMKAGTSVYNQARVYLKDKCDNGPFPK